MGLLLPGDRKSMQPISSRVAPEDVEQIHHFVGTSCWKTGPVEEVLWQKADALLGGDTSYIIVDDNGLAQEGDRVGWRGASILRSPWEAGELSVPSFAHADAQRRVHACRLALIPAASVDK